MIEEEGEGGLRSCEGDAALMPPNFQCLINSTVTQSWGHGCEDSTRKSPIAQSHHFYSASLEQLLIEKQFVLRWGGYDARGTDDRPISNLEVCPDPRCGLGTLGNENVTDSLICDDGSRCHGDGDGICGGEDRLCNRYGNHCGVHSVGRFDRCGFDANFDGDVRRGYRVVKHYVPCIHSVDPVFENDHQVEHCNQ